MSTHYKFQRECESAADSVEIEVGVTTNSVRTEAEELRHFFRLCAADSDSSNGSALQPAVAISMDLLAAAVMFCDNPEYLSRARALVRFCRDEAAPVCSCSGGATQLSEFVQRAQDQWGDCLALLNPEDHFCPEISNWSGADQDDWNTPNGDLLPSNSWGDQTADNTAALDVAGILASLNLRELASQPDSADVCYGTDTDGAYPAEFPSPPDSDSEAIDDPQMAAAFADDAQQCLTEMESSLLGLSADRPNAESLRNFCRQLHTLKGASGTAGLSRLARYLHEVESRIEAPGDSQISVDCLLECVDVVRSRLSGSADVPAAVSSVTPVSATAHEVPPAAASPESARTRSVTSVDENEMFVRVEASRLERLMDLLAELVMLRNDRDAHVQSLREVHKELNLCASRARTLTTMVELQTPPRSERNAANAHDLHAAATPVRFLSRSISELAGDTAELSRSLQDVFEPLSRNNSSVSHLIGRFRQELMDLRRLPVGGLFQRLQRAVHDAARLEHKQVDLVFEGQGARAERGVQQRLFEPLLHIVRNAVSHGIQLPEERIRAGKPPVGRITLTARSDAASLTIEVRDDGRGLDEQVLEARGRELGLLPPGDRFTSAQLRQLIFHPGFTTRKSVSEVSGRGIGMDVVDSWVRRLRGRIDVESVVGQGTLFRLRIPLRSAIEHAMIVRAGQQLFALPMHAVSGTSDSRLPMSGIRLAEDSRIQSLNRLLNAGDTQVPGRCLIALRGTEQPSAAASSRSMNMILAVDEIAGVEEVVVRSLPPLLQRHELFSGVTLSGRAEKVLLLDAGRLLELFRRSADRRSAATGHSVTDPCEGQVGTGIDTRTQAESGYQQAILIVDDSVVVRKNLSRRLKNAGYETLEAGDGHAALKLIRAGRVAGVVTDVDMPEMNGIELIQELRRQKQWHSMPVTVLSSRDADLMPPELQHLQPSAVLCKPVSDETAREIVAVLHRAGVKAVRSQ